MDDTANSPAKRLWREGSAIQKWRLGLLGLEALVALFAARLKLASLRPGDIAAVNTAAVEGLGCSRVDPETDIACVTAIIPSVAYRVPWRSDCLVQALAAQGMLRRRRIASQIVVGAKKPEGEVFESHAWLTVHDRTILGGDVVDYVEFLGRKTTREPNS